MADFRLINCNWNAEILAARRAHSGRLRIICPFIKAATLKRILQAARCDEIEIITRFDLGCFNQGVSDLDALRLVLEAGGQVRGVKGLHSKLYLFGETAAIATSANVTEAAFHRNHEFGFFSTDEEVVATCGAYFTQLWRAAKPTLKPKQIADWETLLRQQRTAGEAERRKTGLPDFGAEIAQSSPFTEPDMSAPPDNQAFIKFFGTARNRANRSMRVDDMIAENGANWACTYPESKPPRQVEDGDVIYMGRLVYSSNDLLIFGKAIGRRHRDAEDRASAEEIAARGWKADWPRYVRVHDGRFVDATLADGISMAEMLHALGADAFASTQRHAHANSGNTDPFASYGRKAHMLLTDQSRAWIDERLDAALRRHGEVDLARHRFQPPQ